MHTSAACARRQVNQDIGDVYMQRCDGQSNESGSKGDWDDDESIHVSSCMAAVNGGGRAWLQRCNFCITVVAACIFYPLFYMQRDGSL